MSELKQTDFRLGCPRMMMSSGISAHVKELGIQSFGVARKDSDGKIEKEIVDLQFSEAGQGDGPLLPLPRPSRCLKTVKVFFFESIYLFIWLLWVLVAACECFLATCGI